MTIIVKLARDDEDMIIIKQWLQNGYVSKCCMHVCMCVCVWSRGNVGLIYRRDLFECTWVT